MRISNVLPLIAIFISLVSGVQNEEEIFDLALELIHNSKSHLEQVYNQNNIYGGLYIPQYDFIEHDYVNRVDVVDEDLLRGIELLESNTNHLKSIITLADLNIFGHDTLKVNYSKALKLYERAVEIEGNGHAYFMLGFIYSTGLFGEVPMDQAKANLYYQFAMENGDTNATLVLAYKNFHGIGVPANCELGLHYYSRLSHLGMKYLSDNYMNDPDEDLVYNIRLSDFNGGIYGDKMSETPTSIISKEKIYSQISNQYDEHNLDVEAHEYVQYYYDALKYYDGDYFLDRDYTKAIKLLSSCVTHGDKVYGPSKYKSINELDKFYLSRCHARLGHMYLRGIGIEQNYDMAQFLLETSLKVKETANAMNDLGYMHENALGKFTERNSTKALEYYFKASDKDSNEARLNRARILTELSPAHNPMQGNYGKLIFTQIKNAMYNHNTKALYYFSNFLQSGLAQQVEPNRQLSCVGTVVYNKIFVEKMEKLFQPHLKSAFDELIKGNYKNALIRYLIAAEQGLENAQMSSSYLLYQVQPLLQDRETKTFSEPRIRAAIKYLELASTQKNVDATILLGDIYLNGLEQFEKDSVKAFSYYKKAAQHHSSHGCFRLAHMYEYGLGTVNNSVDYFMAKRYYDLSIQYKEELDAKLEITSNHIPINWALLRLRFKYLFNKKKFKNNHGEQGGWFKAFKNIGNTNHKVVESDKANDKATAHHEGTTLIDEAAIEVYEIADYVVIFVTLFFFVAFFVQNLVRQWRRRRNPQENEENRNGNQFDWNGNGLQIRRGNFEFQFFAL